MWVGNDLEAASDLPLPRDSRNPSREQVSGIGQDKAKVHRNLASSAGMVQDAPELTAAALANMCAHAHMLTCTQKSECTEDKKPLHV